MDIIIGWQKYETEFSGGKVGMVLKPLSREAMLITSPKMGYFMRYKDKTPEEIEELLNAPGSTDGIEQLLELQGVCAQVFPAHVKDIAGIMVKESADAQAVPVTVEQLVDEAVFSVLCSDILTQLFTMSIVNKGQAKN